MINQGGRAGEVVKPSISRCPPMYPIRPAPDNVCWYDGAKHDYLRFSGGGGGDFVHVEAGHGYAEKSLARVRA